MYCYVVKLPVFSLQRGSAKSPIAPSNFSSLWLPILYFLNYYPGKLTKVAILNVQKILCTEFVKKMGKLFKEDSN